MMVDLTVQSEEITHCTAEQVEGDAVHAGKVLGSNHKSKNRASLPPQHERGQGSLARQGSLRTHPSAPGMSARSWRLTEICRRRGSV